MLEFIDSKCNEIKNRHALVGNMLRYVESLPAPMGLCSQLLHPNLLLCCETQLGICLIFEALHTLLRGVL